MKQYLNKIFYILGRDRRKIPVLILFFFGAAILDVIGIGLIAPYVALVIDASLIDDNWISVIESLNLPSDHSTRLVIAGVFLLTVFVLRALTAIWVNSAITNFSTKQISRLSSLLMSSYQNLPYTEYLNRNSSEYIYTVQVLTSKFSSVLLSLLRVISDGIVALFIIILLALKNPNALLILISLLAIMVFGYDRILRERVKNYGKRANNSATKLVQGVQEGVRGMKEIRVLRKEKYFYNSVRLSAEENAHCMARTQILTAIPRFLLELLLITFVVLLVIITVLTGGNMQELTPTLSMFSVAALRLLPTANTFSNTLMNLRHGVDSISRLYLDLQYLENCKYTDTINNNQRRKDIDFESLALNNISFTYPNASSPTIKNVSLKIKKGESIGLIGTSGSGKTTIVNILLGLLTPQFGDLSYNDITTKEGLIYWNDRVAYLPQEVFLIDDTLRNNIALGVSSDQINDKKIYKSLHESLLIELVSQLPEGIDTIIGEQGVRLSGGQRQRVALARALYHACNILVMDEATSALDSETEKEIVDGIKRLKGKNTMVIIAHRLTTLQYCDRVYEFRDGKVVNYGTYQEVIKGKST